MGPWWLYRNLKAKAHKGLKNPEESRVFKVLKDLRALWVFEALTGFAVKETAAVSHQAQTKKKKEKRDKSRKRSEPGFCMSDCCRSSCKMK